MNVVGVGSGRSPQFMEELNHVHYFITPYSLP